MGAGDTWNCALPYPWCPCPKTGLFPDSSRHKMPLPRQLSKPTRVIWKVPSFRHLRPAYDKQSRVCLSNSYWSNTASMAATNSARTLGRYQCSCCQASVASSGRDPRAQGCRQQCRKIDRRPWSVSESGTGRRVGLQHLLHQQVLVQHIPLHKSSVN
jgi:hypothetical protein